jgi:hypothetical protein
VEKLDFDVTEGEESVEAANVTVHSPKQAADLTITDLSYACVGVLHTVTSRTTRNSDGGEG